jgi:hypothetical protein
VCSEDVPPLVADAVVNLSSPRDHVRYVGDVAQCVSLNRLATRTGKRLSFFDLRWGVRVPACKYLASFHFVEWLGKVSPV